MSCHGVPQYHQANSEIDRISPRSPPIPVLSLIIIPSLYATYCPLSLSQPCTGNRSPQKHQWPSRHVTFHWSSSVRRSLPPYATTHKAKAVLMSLMSTYPRICLDGTQNTVHIFSTDNKSPSSGLNPGPHDYVVVTTPPRCSGILRLHFSFNV